MQRSSHPRGRAEASVSLRALTLADVDAHNAGEDDETVRWLTGAPSTTASTSRHFATLAENARRGDGKRGFGVLLDGSLVGYIDYDPGAEDMPAEGDVNIAYAVHPAARGRGVATAAVALICAEITAAGVGRRAVIRADPENTASIGVARSSGFTALAPPEDLRTSIGRAPERTSTWVLQLP